MRVAHLITLLVAAAGMPLAMLASTAWAAAPHQVSARPKLSAEVRRALAEGGAAAAERRFAEIYPSKKADYDLDVQHLLALGTERLQAGDTAGAQAVMKMWTAVLQDQQAVMAAAAGTGEPGSAASPRAAGPPAGGVDAGPARADLARFHGIYGDQPPTPGTIFVRETCDGHLQVGGLYGDVAPWTMRSESDLAFVQAFVPPTQEMPEVRVEFVLAPGGAVRAVRHGLTGQTLTIERSGGLPDGWPPKDCGGLLDGG